jgi:hypothetical protein
MNENGKYSIVCLIYEFDCLGIVFLRELLKTINKKTYKLNGEIFNIGTEVGTSTNIIASFFGGDTIYQKGVLESEKNISSIDKMKNILNWEPKIVLSKKL